MASIRQGPAVMPAGLEAMTQHPSYALHGIAQHFNAQHRSAQATQWGEEMAANPYGQRSRPQYRT